MEKILLVMCTFEKASLSAFFEIQFSSVFQVQVCSILTTKKRELLQCYRICFSITLYFILLPIQTLENWNVSALFRALFFASISCTNCHCFHCGNVIICSVIRNFIYFNIQYGSFLRFHIENVSAFTCTFKKHFQRHFEFKF